MELDKSERKALVDLVRTASKTEIMPRFRSLSAEAIRAKSAPDDLVTEADVAAEHFISEGVSSILSGCAIVGEEAVENDRNLLDQIATADLAVIIDPIDGTWNFANGLATFGVILAVTHKGETVFGLLYDPVMDDWITASQGNGAWFCRPDAEPQQLFISTTADYSQMVGYSAQYLVPQPAREKLAAQNSHFARTGSLRCSCHEYRMLAQGNVDFIFNGGMKPWDHAAGILIAQEAGGVAACLDGTPYSPTRHQGYSFVANNPENLAGLLEQFSWMLTPE